MALEDRLDWLTNFINVVIVKNLVEVVRLLMSKYGRK